MTFSKLEKLETRARKAQQTLDRIQDAWEEEYKRVQKDMPITFRKYMERQNMESNYSFGDVLA